MQAACSGYLVGRISCVSQWHAHITGLSYLLCRTNVSPVMHRYRRTSYVRQPTERITLCTDIGRKWRGIIQLETTAIVSAVE